MRYSSRFFLWAPVAIFAALVVAVGVHWFVTANALSRYMDSVNGHEIAPGVKLSFAKRQMAGFPFRLDVIADDLRLEIAGSHGPIQWRAEHFAIHSLDYGRVQAIFEAAGKQTLTWTDENGHKQALQFLPALLRASAIEDSGRLSRFDLELIGAASADFTAANVQFHLRHDPAVDALDVAFNADEIHLAPGLKSAFGQSIARIRLDARLGPETALDDLLSGKNNWRAMAENWRTHAGAVDLRQLEIAWDKTEAAASGELTLDSMQRPQGLLTLRIKGQRALAAGIAGLSGDKKLFGSMLDALAKNPGTDADSFSTQLAFKDGVTYVGQIPAGFADPLY